MPEPNMPKEGRHHKLTHKGAEMTNAEAHLVKALERIAEPKAFFVATSNVDPEAYARMVFANQILKGASVDAAEAATEMLTKKRYSKEPDSVD